MKMGARMGSNVLRLALLPLVFLLVGCSLFGSGTHRHASVTRQTIPQPKLPGSDSGLENHVPKQMVVGLERGVSPEAVAAELGAEVVKALPALNAALLQLPADSQVVDGVRQLEGDSRVRYAEPNYEAVGRPYMESAFDLPSHSGSYDASPFAPGSHTASTPQPHLRQWGINAIGAHIAWQRGITGEDVFIAVLDTGIDGQHPDLGFNGKIRWGINTTSDDKDDWQDRNGHGTHVAGIAAGAGMAADGVVGVAYNSSLLAIKVLGDDGRGSNFDIAEGLFALVDWRKDNGRPPTVANMSLGSTHYGHIIKEAVDAAAEDGVVIVAAMGNDARNTLAYPAAYPGVIAVGAVAPGDRLAGFSSTWKHISVAAPGVDIYSAYPISTGRWYATLSGTSMATPFVSGAAALLLARDPSLTPAQVKSRLETFARHPSGLGERDKQLGYGVVNVPGSLFGDSELNFYGNVKVTVIDQDGDPIDTNKYDTPPWEYRVDFIVELRIENPSHPELGPIFTDDDGTAVFYHVPVGAGNRVVATAWTTGGSSRSAIADIVEVRPGKTEEIIVQLNLQ